MAARELKFFEKHSEKLFLALAAAGLLGVVAWQLGSPPAKVNVGTRTGVELPRVYPTMQEESVRLKGKMDDPAPRLPELPKTDLAESFRQKLGAGVSPSAAWAYVPPAPKLPDASGGGLNPAAGAALTRLPTLPNLSKPVGHAFMQTIDAAEVKNTPGLAGLVPAAAPFDKAAVSVDAQIDGLALRQALESDPDGAGPLVPLQKNWWDGLSVLAVELVRQELGANGEWGSEVVVPPMPGRFNLAEQLRAAIADVASLNQLAQQAANNELDIVRPEFYRRAMLAGVEAGDEWVAPSDAVEDLAGVNPELLKAQRRLKSRQSDIVRLQKAIEQQKQLQRGNPAPGGGRPGGGGGRPGGPGGVGPGAGGPGGGGGPAVDPIQEGINNRQRQLDQAIKDVEDLRKQIEKLGGKATKAPSAAEAAQVSSLLAQKVQLWAHDLTAARGKTYRYALRAKLNNPLFLKNTEVQPADVDQTKSATITLASDGWSEPVRVDDEVYYFVTSAEGPDVTRTTAIATADVFTFTWGYWRSGKVVMQPGDPIAARVSVPDGEKIAALVPAAPAPGAPGAPAGPGGPVGPGGPRAPIGPGVNPADGAPAGEPARGPGNAPAPAGLAAGAPLPVKELELQPDAFLLDVLTRGTVVRQRAQYVALLRDVDGRAVQRDPIGEAASIAYRRLVSSAQKGVQQIAAGVQTPAPAAGGPPERGPRPLPQGPAMPPSAPSDGGGGGGGGTGGG